MLPWLAPVFEQIVAVHEAGRLPHALLIRSVAGWGEIELADHLARHLIEREDAASARTLAHPDLKWIQPDGSVIKVDEVRELAVFAVGTRQSARCKVAVVESAELMNVNAANALLKTLEEPPADTYLILASSRPARLLPTVVSRCQAIVLPRDPERARAWLAARWPETDLDEKLFECGDAPLHVDEALTSGEPLLSDVLRELARATPSSRAVTPLLNWNVDRLTAGWYRHCVALLAGTSRIRAVATASGGTLATFADELLSVRRQLLTTNSANQRLLYERLAARWQAAVARTD